MLNWSRGSGKSTIIEAIRYSFDLNKNLGDLEKAGKELAEKAISLQNATLTDCIIRVAYISKDGQPYILEATYVSKQDCTTRIFDINGDTVEVQDIEYNFPIRLFGWSEIETLGRETNRQRELLDQMIVGFSGDVQSRNDMRSQLELKRNEINASIIRLSEILNKDDGIIKKYREYKADFDKLNTEEIQALFKDIDNTKSEISVLTKLKENIIKFIEEITKYEDIDLFQGIEDIISSCNDVETINSWWNGQDQKSSFVANQTDIKEKISSILNTLEVAKNHAQSNIDTLNASLTEKGKKLREEIGEDVTSTLLGAEHRRIAKERLDKVELLRRDYYDRWKAFNKDLAEWTKLLESITKVQKIISDKRGQLREEIEEKLNKFSTEDMKISVLFSEGQDKQDFIQHITDSGILTKNLHGNWRANQWPQIIGLLYTPIEFAPIILDSSKDHTKFDKRLEISGQELMIDEDMAKILISTLHPFSVDTDADVPIIDKSKIDKILKLAGVKWDDYESILLNDKPVTNCSPGQRSSAMLPLIALVEDIPLIIDQPEDNLDNRLVGKMLVDILSGLKENRQIIVSTHNPNIVVSGDAEQVAALEAESNREGRLSVYGSIDNTDVVKTVIEVMEGGVQAFQARRARYGL